MSGSATEGITFFEALAEMQPDKAEVRSVLALLFHLTGNPEAALRQGLEALRGKKNDVALMMTVGEIYLALQEMDNARDILNRAYTEARATGHPATNRITLLLQSNRP